MTTFLTPKQMTQAERNCGVPLDRLMENAGEALGERVREMCYKKMCGVVLLLCGNGNNGGDGFVAARLLARSGITPVVLLCCGEPKTELSKNAFEKISGVRVCRMENDNELSRLFENAGVIVDCIFGTGFHSQMPADVARLIALANGCDAYKIACDVPSGINSLTGEVSAAFKADETLTMHKGKIGMSLYPACEYCGEIFSADIGINFSCDEISLFDKKDLHLPARQPDGHKGTFGRVVCICGSEKYTGAAAMSVRAALRSGAGLVELCTVKSVIDRLSGNMFEAVYTQLTFDNCGYISADSIDIVEQSIKSADAVLIGCGIGVSEGTREVLEFVLKNCKCPVVVDADGINLLALNIDILKSKQAEVVLTPHPMELARLIGCDKPCIDRYTPAKALSEEYGVTVMAKGAQTFVVGDEQYICRRGNTALSKGGSGDILAGLTAGLIAQGMSAARACASASVILGSAAEELSRNMSERGIIAGDILNFLPRLLFNME